MSSGRIGNIESEKFANKYTLPQLRTIAKHFEVNQETLFMNYNEDSITTEECLSRVCNYIVDYCPNYAIIDITILR